MLADSWLAYPNRNRCSPCRPGSQYFAKNLQLPEFQAAWQQLHLLAILLRQCSAASIVFDARSERALPSLKQGFDVQSAEFTII
jgi:hypothetical protein